MSRVKTPFEGGCAIICKQRIRANIDQVLLNISCYATASVIMVNYGHGIRQLAELGL